MLTRIQLAVAIMVLSLIPAANAQSAVSGGSAAAKSSAGDPATVQTQPSTPADPNYLIGVQDVLDISVWKEPDLSRSVPVRPDGKISLPLLNDVQAAGLTPNQLTEQLTTALKKYIDNPVVSVIVSQINSQRVYVLGEVARAGAYPLLPGMTVLQALSSAGGFTQFANQKKIYILRQVNGKQEKYPFNYKQALDGTNEGQNIILQPGDTIVVP